MDTLQENTKLIDAIIQHGTQLSQSLDPDSGAIIDNGARARPFTSNLLSDYQCITCYDVCYGVDTIAHANGSSYHECTCSGASCKVG